MPEQWKELKEFLEKCECHIYSDMSIIAIIRADMIEEFTDLFNYDYFECGLDCKLLYDGHIGIELSEIFEDYDLDLKFFKSCFVENKYDESCFEKYLKMSENGFRKS